MNKKQIVGFLIVLITLTSVYVTFSNQVRIRVDRDKTTFYVPSEKYSWIWTVSGREYNKLFDGSKQMNRDLSSIHIDTNISGNDVYITRYTKYIRGPVIKDTYYFRGDIKNKELFPISHQVEIFNASGKFYRYEVRDLTYDGPTYKLHGETLLEFGKNMKVSLNPDYRWAWVYKTGIVKAQYDIKSDYEVFNVRLFDPTWWNSNWNYRKTITITENSGNDLINYPIVVWFNHSGNAKADCSDIRVINTTDNEIDFGLRNCNSTHVELTFKIDVNASSTSDYNVYYGNTNANFANSSWNDIRYNIYDAFDGNAINTSIWSPRFTGGDLPDVGDGIVTFPENKGTDLVSKKHFNFSSGVYIVMELDYMQDGTHSGDSHSAMFGSNDSTIAWRIEHQSWASYGWKWNLNGWKTGDNSWAQDQDWHHLIIKMNNTCENFTWDDPVFSVVENQNHAATFPNSDTVGFLFSLSSPSTACNVSGDNFTLYLLADPEPTYSIGSETVSKISPQWSANNSYSPSSYSPLIHSQFNVTWSDDKDSNGYNFSYIEINYTGTPHNYTTTRDENTSYYDIILGAGTYTWKFYANDSEDLWSSTDSWITTISTAQTQTILLINGTHSDSTLGNGTVANFTVYVNASGETVGLDTNMTGWTIQTGTTPLYNYTLLSEFGKFNITGFYEGNDNYTSSSDTLYLDVLKSSHINLYLNGLNADRYYDQGSVVTLKANFSSDIDKEMYLSIYAPGFGVDYINSSSVNITWLDWDDTEDSYACEGTFSTGTYDCSHAVDEDWVSAAATTGSYIGNSHVYENYTIPSNVRSAQIYFKAEQADDLGAHSVLRLYNYTSNDWQVVYNSSDEGGTSGMIYRQVNITSDNATDFLSDGILQIDDMLVDESGSYLTNWYETKVRFGILNFEYNFTTFAAKQEFSDGSTAKNVTFDEFYGYDIQLNSDSILDDAYVVQSYPDSNYGTDDHISVGTYVSDLVYGYMKFNLSDVFDKQILNARLFVYVYDTTYESGEQINISVYQVNDQTWSENDITWNERPSYSQFITKNSTYYGDNATPYWMSFDITDWLELERNNEHNASLFFSGAQSGSDLIQFYSKEYGSFMPYIKIVYTNSSINKTVNVTFNKYDYVTSGNISLTGYNTNGLPKNVKLYIDNVLDTNIVGELKEGNVTLSTFNDGTKTKDFVYDSPKTITGYFELPKTAIVNNATVNVTGKQSVSALEGCTAITNGWSFYTDACDSDYSTSAMLGSNHAGYIIQNYTIGADATNIEYIKWYGRIIVFVGGTRGAYIYNFTDDTWDLFDNSLPSIPTYYSNVTVAGSNMTDYYQDDMIRIKIYGDLGDMDQINYYEGWLNVKMYPHASYIDVSGDGDVEWIENGDFNITNTTDDFGSELSDYLSTCTPDSFGYCLIPINLKSDGGTLTIDNIEINYTQQYNPITLNTTAISYYLNNSNDETVNVPFIISSDSNGTVEMSDLAIYYKGSDNITVTANFYGDSEYAPSSDTHSIMNVYSDVNLNTLYPYMEFFPSFLNDTNITPYGQSDTIPFWNITTMSYDKTANMSIYLNSNLPSCINMSVSTTSSKDDAVILNTTKYPILNNIETLPVTTWYGLWFWVDLYNCNATELHSLVTANVTYDLCCADCINCWS